MTQFGNYKGFPSFKAIEPKDIALKTRQEQLDNLHLAAKAAYNAEARGEVRSALEDISNERILFAISDLAEAVKRLALGQAKMLQLEQS